MPEVHLPNGKIINFPDDTAPEEMDSAIQQAMGGPTREKAQDFAKLAQSMPPQDLEIARTKNDEFGVYLRHLSAQPVGGESEQETFQRLYGGLGEQEPVGTGEGVARAGLQGASFGAGDEIVAAGAAALDPLMKGSGGTFADRYNAYLAREREKLSQFREEQPVAAYGTEIAGALPTAALTAGASAAPSLGGRIMSGMATGAAQGATYGFLSGEGGPVQRAESAGQAGAVGGAVGAVAPVVGAGARNVVSRVAASRGAKELGTTAPAYRVLERAASADTVRKGEGARNIARGGRTGMLADAGPSMRSLLDTAIQRSGPAGTKARRAIETRARYAGMALKKTLDNTLGERRGVKAIESGLRSGTQPMRSAAYKAAYGKPINYASEAGQRIENLVRNRVPPSAIRKANALMRVEGERSRQVLFDVADDGTVAFRQMPDVRQIDYITRALQDVAEAENAKGALGGTTGLGRAYGGLKSELRGLLREAVPEYGKALDTAADPIAKRAALKLGSGALSTRVTRDEFAEQIAGMSAAERRFVAQGIREQLDDAMANVRRAMTDTNMSAREGMQAVRMLTTRASRDKMEMLLGPERAGQLFDQIDQSLMALDLKAAVRENSRTFARLAMDESIMSQTDEGVVNAIRSGEPISAGKRAAQTVMGRTAADRERIADETYSAIVDALTGPQGSAAINQVKAMEVMNATNGLTAEQARNLGEWLFRSNVGLTGPAMQALPE